MRTMTIVVAAWLAASSTEGQTVIRDSSARTMPLKVYDATGKLMAGVVANPDGANVYYPVTLRYSPTGVGIGDSFSLAIQADADSGHVRYKWFELATVKLFFASHDCTGQAYVEALNPLGGRRLALLDYETNWLYLSGPDPAIVLQTYHSSKFPQQPCVDAGSGGSFMSVPIDPIVDMDDVFPEPFQVR